MVELRKTQADPDATLAEIKALREQLARAQAETEALKARVGNGNGRISCKVSTKGALSVYGLGRFPVTLYASQWSVLLSAGGIDTVRKALESNKSALATKT